MSIEASEWQEYKEKTDELYAFLFKEGVDGRSGESDMRLIRVLIHRFRSAKFFLGMIIGVLTVGVPAIYGIFKLIELIRTLFKAG